MSITEGVPTCRGNTPHEYSWCCPHMYWDHPLWVWATYQEPRPHRGVTLPLHTSTAQSPFPIGGGLRGPSPAQAEILTGLYRSQEGNKSCY